MEFTRDAQPKPDDVLLAAPVPRAMDGTPKAAIKEAVEDVIYGSVSSLALGVPACLLRLGYHRC